MVYVAMDEWPVSMEVLRFRSIVVAADTAKANHRMAFF
jgi:hypothetical protein